MGPLWSATCREGQTCLVPLRLMTEAGIWEGWDREGEARLRGDQTGSVSQPFNSFLSFSIKEIHGPSVTPFPQRIN